MRRAQTRGRFSIENHLVNLCYLWPIRLCHLWLMREPRGTHFTGFKSVS